MARKDLSRTVIEGGRYYRNSWDRRASHGAERASTRAWLDTLDDDDLALGEATAPPPIRHVDKSFRDKLGPAQRWLVSQVGRPWDKVYSELRENFDTRTVAGRHVVVDHMLPMVRRHPPIRRRHRSHELYVDEHGILRKSTQFARSYQTERREIAKWAAGRVCALTYRGWWWFRRQPVGDACYDHACTRHHFTEPNRARHHRQQILPIAPMTAAEVRYLEGIADDWRRSLIIASPW